MACETAGGTTLEVVLRWAAVGAWWTLQLAELPAPDALDEALPAAAGPVGEEYDGVDAVPFDPGRRWAAAVVQGGLGRHTVVVTRTPVRARRERGVARRRHVRGVR